MRDLDARMRRTLARVRTACGVSLAFGGPVAASGAVGLELFEGRTVGALAGVVLEPGKGLGGKAAELRRLLVAEDYFATPFTTSRYRALIKAEGLRSIVAVPVIVGRRPVGVIYGAVRDGGVLGGRVQDTLTAEARSLEQEIVAAVARPEPLDGADLAERLRAVHADLRVIARSVADPELRERLSEAAERLVAAPEPPAVALTPRELDVLALVGTGLSNAQIGALLGLRLHTVKSYLKAATAKLDATSRLDAVARARRAGLLA